MMKKEEKGNNTGRREIEDERKRGEFKLRNGRE